jgi:hypothetical protein
LTNTVPAESWIGTAVVELLAMKLHGKMSPTDWLHLTTEQRNSTRRRADKLVNEAMDFWMREMEKEQAPL